MDPNIKLVLDEMSKRFGDEIKHQFDDLDTKLDKRFGDMDERVQALESSLETATSAFETWKPYVDSAVEDLKLEILKLNKHLDRALRERASTDPGLLEPPLSALVAV